jgi:hypothetical protein
VTPIALVSRKIGSLSSTADTRDAVFSDVIVLSQSMTLSLDVGSNGAPSAAVTISGAHIALIDLGPVPAGWGSRSVWTEGLRAGVVHPFGR